MKKRNVFPFGVLCLLLLFVFFLFAGCKGDTGPAGAAGTSVSLNDCDACHHLNSLAVNEFNEIFVTGLAGANQTVSGGTGTTFSFDATKLPAGETAVSFQWTRIGGQEATISAPAVSSTLVTLPTITDYKAELVRHVGGLEIRDVNGTIRSDRTKIVPVNPHNLEEAVSAQLKLRVATASGKFYYSLVNLVDSTGETEVANFAAENNGINNVPINVPVLLRTRPSVTGFNWSVTGPGGAAVTVADPLTALPSFTPTTPGTYTASEAVSGTTIPLFAGTWKGVIVGQDANGRPVADSTCLACHNNTIAPDKFTPWKDSGHAEIFTQLFNGSTPHGTGCFPCHTVGFNTGASASNNGFDDQPNYANFLSTYFASDGLLTTNPNNWTNLLATYPDVARMANVQCENCHGPQEAGEGVDNTAHRGVAGSPRVSMAADVCARCHGEPQRHAKFQQWEESGHGYYALSAQRGMSTSCAACHSAQGFMLYLQQLQSGSPLRALPAASITWTVDTVLPQTCPTCHDPHIQGTQSGKPNTANLRIEDNTPKLPAGFAATGVGRGAICIMCHNTRNGTPTSGAFNVEPFNQDAFLHQDGDPVWGILASYAAPHTAAQGDLLLGYNAYFVGSGNYRSPHSIIIDTCANCHMEQTPPPALLSYNLAGTNHTFRPSLAICKNCHATNTALGPMLQATVHSTLEVLKETIEAKIISRNTGTPIATANLTESGGQPAVAVVFNDSTTATIQLNNLPGVRISDLGTDELAKAVWNFLLIEGDGSFGVHNPDYTFAVLGASQRAADAIPNQRDLSRTE